MAGNLSLSVEIGLVIAAVFIAVLWIALPFAVFGLKPLLRALLDEQKRTNDLLQKRMSTRSNAPESSK